MPTLNLILRMVISGRHKSCECLTGGGYDAHSRIAPSRRFVLLGFFNGFFSHLYNIVHTHPMGACCAVSRSTIWYPPFRCETQDK